MSGFVNKDSRFSIELQMLVSIIIPVYKVEPYIVRCVDSVLQQTYRNLEIILVDDCSPDHSMELAQEYIKASPLSTDLHFIFLKHEHNRGLSAARNTGIDAATGEYIFFLDSDDQIVPDCITSLIKISEYRAPEMIVGSVQSIDKNGNKKYQLLSDEQHEGTKNIRDLFLNKSIYEVAWNKLIKLDFIKRNQLYFIEGIIHEDTPWTFFCVNKLVRIATSSIVTYQYYLRSDSIMGNQLRTNKYKRYNSLLKIVKVLNEGFEEGILLCDFSNIDYFSQFKYNLLYEYFIDSKISIIQKVRYGYCVFNTKWKFLFVAKSLCLFIKHIGFRFFHKL